MFGETGNAQLGVSGTDSVVMVVDVKGTMLKEAKGKAVKPEKGMPTVKYSTDQPASFTMPKGKAPKDTQVETLVAGDGPEVKKGDTVYVTYTGALWKNGKVFDSSKKEGGRPFPVTLGAGQVIKGWDEGLVGTKVGDRVLLVIPPKDGYGATGSQDGSITKDDTIVFVVDVLGAV
jgi:peptidylprolyl isomerase